MTPQEFVSKWRGSKLNERQAYQQHFIDLCVLVGHQSPAAADKTGSSFAFEYHVEKVEGGKGFADVWKKNYFAWEYKGPNKDLRKAYNQLLQYRESLQNPPLLIVSDLERIEVHTNFTNTVKQVIELPIEDLVKPEGMAKLRSIFFEPEAFRAPQTTEQVTRQAAAEFARISAMLAATGADPHAAAHFLIRLLFSLFAEDIELLPKGLFTDLVSQMKHTPNEFTGTLQDLFSKMATGGQFGRERIRYFNGGLFNDASVLPMSREMLEILDGVSRLDWSSIEPAILGTLFERSLDPAKRSQLGAHYTSREDILLIVEPVLMTPLRRRWEEVQAETRKLKEEMDAASSNRVKDNRFAEIGRVLRAFATEIASVQVLDPACGSGNFLYVALKQLLDLEKEVIVFAGNFGITSSTPLVSPAQLHGIELNAYAHELAQATIWIGYIQWLKDNGFGIPPEPILSSLNAIINMDAILAYDEHEKPVEPEWPKADVIVGNPPFLGDKKMRRELGDHYVDALRRLYSSRIAGGADLVTYWFERARSLVESGRVRRVGLLATNSIRSGANREVLQRIKETGDIFMAWSDRPWVLDAANVRVSMIGFDHGIEQDKTLDGLSVSVINSDLTSRIDVTGALGLRENEGICFLGMMKAGPFDLDATTAESMLKAPVNPNGRPNSDVVKRRMGGQDVVGQRRDIWIIDFGVDMPESNACLYEMPFEFVRSHVKPVRALNRRKRLKEKWWIHGEARPGLRKASRNLKRCIVTPEVSKHRVFQWMDTSVVPDHKLHVIARDDDYFFGILHSRVHELWSLAQCSWMGVGNDPSYSSSRTFGTFPFPWPPGKEPKEDPRVIVIADAARELVEKRDRWLNPEGITEAELKKRTLTNLYNQRPTWLAMAHERLDNAVLDAYGWPHNLTDEEILARLLSLNLERSKGK